MLTVLRHASFSALWQPDMLLGLAAVAAAYLLVVGPLRRRIRGATPVSPGQVLAFLGCLVSVYGAAGSPLDYLADHYLVSAHIVEHTALGTLSAPLLLLGTPDWFWRPLLNNRFTREAFSTFTSPLFGIVFFNGAFTFLHLPYFVDLSVQSDVVHLLEHALLMISAVSMWWAVFSPLPERPRLAPPLQILYFFVDSIAMTLIFAYLTFYGHPLYAAYGNRARLFGLTPYEDQQLGAVIMKTYTEVVYGIGVLVSFFRWARESALAERLGTKAQPIVLRAGNVFGIRTQHADWPGTRAGRGGRNDDRR